MPGLILLLEGTAATHMAGRGRPEPVGRQVAPTWIGAISVLTEDPLPVRIVAETRVPPGDRPAAPSSCASSSRSRPSTRR